MDFVNGLVDSFSESDSERGDGGSFSVGDTPNFVEDLLRLSETDSDSEGDAVGFVHDLVLSYESDGENGDISDIDDHSDHALDFFTPYEDQDSTSEEEMEVAHPLYDSAPLSDFASRQAIMHFALTNHLSYSATDQLLALLKIHLPSSAKVPKNSGSLRRRFVDDVPLQQYYCPHCFTKLDGGTDGCRDRECQEKGGGTCYFVPVPITPHLKEIFIGEFTLPYLSGDSEGCLYARHVYTVPCKHPGIPC